MSEEYEGSSSSSENVSLIYQKSESVNKVLLEDFKIIKIVGKGTFGKVQIIIV